jgi:hypothetical protein
MPGTLPADALRTLPTDEIRQIMWRLSDRFDAADAGPGGARRRAGSGRAARGRRRSAPTSGRGGKAGAARRLRPLRAHRRVLDPEHGGFIDGPKNLALALVAFELAWVDAGAATCSLAGQPRTRADSRARHARAALVLHAPARARPNPARTAPLAGRVLPHRAYSLRRRRDRPAERQGARREWPEGASRSCGREAWALHHEHGVRQLRHRRRRLRRPAHQGHVHGDPGGDRPRRLRPRHAHAQARAPALVHRTTRSSACACPPAASSAATRVEDGVIVPRYGHGEIIEAVFRRTRVTVGLMTAAKLLSAVEPVLRYQRTRFRGGDSWRRGRRATSSACSRTRTRSTASSTCGRPARRARRSASRPRGSSTSSSRWSGGRTRSSRRGASGRAGRGCARSVRRGGSHRGSLDAVE